MDFLKWLVGGLVGAAIGGAVWIAVGYFLEAEVGYIAWGIGLLAGIGVRIAAGQNDGVMCGIAAVIAAVAVVLSSKYMVVSMQVDAVLADQSFEAFSFTDEDMIMSIASDKVLDYQEAGRQLKWPPGMSLELAETKAQFPQEVWKEAEAEWNALPEEERSQQLKLRSELTRQFAETLADAVKEEGFRESFNPFDLLWLGLAAFTAFRVGSGLVGDD